ncbi:hypothetical protein QBC43DRAFT_292626 [Cladorrhinum sp. PSN259]|nr:hypothetical protein QBC43DRAFT_292626 [Cladorrhinum sp. PSN259]
MAGNFNLKTNIETALVPYNSYGQVPGASYPPSGTGSEPHNSSLSSRASSRNRFASAPSYQPLGPQVQSRIPNIYKNAYSHGAGLLSGHQIPETYQQGSSSQRGSVPGWQHHQIPYRHDDDHESKAQRDLREITLKEAKAKAEYAEFLRYQETKAAEDGRAITRNVQKVYREKMAGIEVEYNRRIQELWQAEGKEFWEGEVSRLKVERENRKALEKRARRERREGC